MKILIWAFYILGVYLYGAAVHELYHWLHCGGSFVAGVAYVQNRIIVETTWCAVNNGAGGEWLPTIVEVLFFLVMIYAKIYHDYCS